jgi:hypothetical protein
MGQWAAPVCLLWLGCVCACGGRRRMEYVYIQAMVVLCSVRTGGVVDCWGARERQRLIREDRLCVCVVVVGGGGSMLC